MVDLAGVSGIDNAKGACKQQESQHAVHHEVGEIDAEEGVCQGIEQMLLWEGKIAQDQRCGDAHDQKADGMRHRQKFPVEPAKHSAEREDNGGEFKDR